MGDREELPLLLIPWLLGAYVQATWKQLYCTCTILCQSVVSYPLGLWLAGCSWKAEFPFNSILS